MQPFVSAQYDFFFFVAGLSLLMLGAVFLSYKSFKSVPLPWFLLGIFGVLQGVSEFLALITLYVGENPFASTAGLLISGGSYYLLWRFARGAGKQGVKWGASSAVSIAGLLVVLLLCVRFGGLGSAGAVTSILGVTSGVYAAAVIFRYGRTTKEIALCSSVMALGLGSYALSTNLIYPLVFAAVARGGGTGTFPVLCIAIQLFRCVTVFVLAIASWYYSQISYFRELKINHPSHNLNFSHIIVLVLSVILVDSWIVTNTIGYNVASSLVEESKSRLDAIYEQVNAELRHTDNIALTVSTSVWLPLVLEQNTPGTFERASSLLDRYRRGFDLDGCYLLDKGGTVIVSSTRDPHLSLVGQNYAARQFFTASMKGEPGRELEFGGFNGQKGYSSSMPVRDQNSQVIGVVVVRSTLEKSARSLALAPVGFLIDPHGIVLLSNREDSIGTTLWPVDETLRQSIVPGAAAPRASFPAFRGPLFHGQKVVYHGNEYTIGRKQLVPAGWSIVLLQSMVSVNWYRFLSICVSCFLCLLVILLCVGIRQKENITLLLSKEKEKAQQYFEVAGVIMVVIDRQGRVTLINKRGCDILGYRYEDIIRRDWFETCVPERARPELRQLFERIWAGEDIPYYENFICTRTGEERLVAWNNVVLRDDENTVTGTLNSGQDITDRKDTEEQLIRAYAELKTAQDQLIQSEKMASIGQLAAGVAHEINNPTGFVISNLDLMGQYAGNVVDLLKHCSELEGTLTSVESGPVKDALEKLKTKEKEYDLANLIKDLPDLVSESHSGAKRIKKIVQDLMTFSRREDGEKVNADVNDILESTLTIAWNELKYKAAVRKDYGTLPAIQCNPNQLGQVFLNLLINAVQAIEAKGEITIKTYAKTHNVFVEISDTGCGIPQENLTKIFDPFFTTKPAGKGTGLGLSLVYNIVRRHNGDITVHSTIGRGTTFVVRLPAPLPQQ